MANFPVDPSQFIPGQFEIIEVANRPQQCRYHVSRTVSAKHEDVVIATIDPVFQGLIHLRIGTAFPSDYWNDDHIRGAVKDLGALISWDKGASSYGALIAKNLGLYQSTFTVRNCWEVCQVMKMCLLLMAPPLTPCPMLPFRVLSQLLMSLPQSTMLLLIGLFGNICSMLLMALLKFHLSIWLDRILIQNNEPPPVIMALPVPEQHMAEDVDMLPNEDNQSDLTVTISSANASSDESGGSVNGGLGNQNLHIGMVLMPELQVDPVALLSSAYTSTRASTSLSAAHGTRSEDFIFSKEGTSAWSTYFKLDGSIINTVKVPAQWADLFTAKLLTPADFEWTKSLLQSKIWQILSDFEAKDDSSDRAFVLPRDCPSEAPPICTLTLACEKITQGFMTPQALKNQIAIPSHSSTLALHLQKTSKKTPMVCSKVRRSNRIKALNKGYKAKTCFDRNFLACAAVGPGIKKSVVTNLCARFNIPEELEEEEDADEEEPTAFVSTDKKQKQSNKKCDNVVTRKTPKKK
ncbi:hypothetical protein ACQ4PT_060987 [Festuca glaucescens]